MKSLIGKQIFFVVKEYTNGFQMHMSNDWEENSADEKGKKGPYIVLDYYNGYVAVQDGLRFRQLNINDIELVTPLTEELQENKND